MRRAHAARVQGILGCADYHRDHRRVRPVSLQAKPDGDAPKLTGTLPRLAGKLRRRHEHLKRGKRGPYAGRGEAGVENEGPAGIDQGLDHFRSPEHGAALPGDRFRQRHGPYHVGLCGEAGRVDAAAAARADHPERVGLVNQEQGTLGTRRPVQFGDRGQITSHRKDRVCDHDRRFLAPTCESLADGRDVCVWGDRDTGAGQSARVNQ